MSRELALKRIERLLKIKVPPLGKVTIPSGKVELHMFVRRLVDENAALRVMHGEAIKAACDARDETVLQALARGRREGWHSAIDAIREHAQPLTTWVDFLQKPISVFLEELDKLARERPLESPKRRRGKKP